MSLATAIYRPLFLKYAKAYRFDPRALEAQAMVESSGKATAFRYEAHKRDASYGLMQVLEATARKVGLPPSEMAASLCDAETGILYGCKAMTDICNWVGAECEMQRYGGQYERMPAPFPKLYRIVLARFNGGGHLNPAPDGSLRNIQYVERVETFFHAVCQETG